MRPCLTASSLLAAILLTAGCATTGKTVVPPDPGDDPDHILDQLVLPTVEGGQLDLGRHAGSVVLLDFWALWCKPCLASLPRLQALHERYRDRGLVVIGVSIDPPSSQAQVGALVRREGLGFPVVLDHDTALIDRFNPGRDLPFYILVDRNGYVAVEHRGYSPGDEEILEEQIRRLL